MPGRLGEFQMGTCQGEAQLKSLDFKKQTVSELLARFEVAPEQQRFLRIFANEEKADPSYVLKDGDELTVIMQIGGG